MPRPTTAVKMGRKTGNNARTATAADKDKTSFVQKMMPNEVRQQNYSVFTDQETLKREERTRRRILRIQQVRQQSKILASKVITQTQQLKEKESTALRQRQQETFDEWKKQQLQCLNNELKFGLEKMGDSMKVAVDAELAEVAKRQEDKEKSERVSQERSLAAGRELRRQQEDQKQQEERRRQDREELRAAEKARAKIVSTLPLASSQKASTPDIQASAESKGNNNLVEVYHASIPLPGQFCPQPANVVQKIPSSGDKLDAKQSAARELEEHGERVEQGARRDKLTSWLGGAAGARLAQEKEYERLFNVLPVREQQLAQTATASAAVTESEVVHAEKMQQQMPHYDGAASTHLLDTDLQPCREDGFAKHTLTAHPFSQLTEEERGMLGPNAASLQTLLDSLLGASRSRLQQVVDCDFDLGDEFDECMSPSPPSSPAPPVQQDRLTLDVRSMHKLTVEIPPSSTASVVTSSSQVHVTASSKSKKKRERKKLKNKLGKEKDAVDQAQAMGEKVDGKTTHGPSAMQPPATEKSPDMPPVQDLASSCAISEKNDEIVDSRRKSSKSKEKHQLETNNQSKQSFVSNSTQYLSPTEDLMGKNLDGYLKALEQEKAQVEAYLQSKQQASSSKNINLPKYVDKLLTMTRDSVAELSVSDVTETSTELTGQRKKKKKTKSKQPVSSSSSGLASTPSTENSMVAVSVPSSGGAPAADRTSEFVSPANLTSSASLKLSESSSQKESSASDLRASSPEEQTNAAYQKPSNLTKDSETTEYLTLHNSQLKLGGAQLGPAAGYVHEQQAMDIIDNPIRPCENARLSTILEGDSAGNESSSSALDVEAELHKRGLPTLRKASPYSVTAAELLSPETKRKMNELNVVPWSVRMMERMKQADNLSSSSSEELGAVAPPRFSDSGVQPAAETAQQLMSHSTPVTQCEGAVVSEISHSHQTERFFQLDTVVSPILAEQQLPSSNVAPKKN